MINFAAFGGYPRDRRGFTKIYGVEAPRLQCPFDPFGGHFEGVLGGPASMSVYDDVDGARSAASECQRVVA
jgi:hypothetical protein